MTKLGDTFVLSQEISITAAEEASRWSCPQIDVEHVFLALVINRGPAGDLLRSLGVDLARARAAVERTHADSIDSLGIRVGRLNPSPIVDPMTRGFAWSERAFAVWKQTSSSHDDVDLLARLIEEPSGLVTDVLAKLDLHPPTVQASIEKCRQHRDIARSSPQRHTVYHTSFIPASIGEVWALVADPLRRPEWDDTIASAEPAGPRCWNLYAAQRRPGGKARRVKVGYQRSQIHEIDSVPQAQIVWEVCLPDLGKDARKHLFSIDVARATGGTDLRLTWRFTPRTGLIGLITRVIAPVSAVMMRHQLIAATAKVSRAFR